MELLLNLAVTLGQWAIGLAGGSVALENLLENFIMARLPQQYRRFVVPIISFIFAVVLNMRQGMAPWPATLAALTLLAGTTYIHNNPKLTTADVSKWTPPADALGVPSGD